MGPSLSTHFQRRQPSSIRLSQIEFLKRKDVVLAVNTAIGNVSLPMHPAMQHRMFNLDAQASPFQQGIVKYTATVGEKETNETFLHLIRASGFSTEGLYCQTTEGGSQAMELAILGVCGPPGSPEKPLLLIDPIYSNYTSLAERIGRSTCSFSRHLEEDGRFSLPKLDQIEKQIQATKPGALLVIPYDNPTGQFFTQKTLISLAALCVKYNLWLISDEAYREIFFTDDQSSSIWALTENQVPGITGRRISIESSSKIWNACGLRIGALITDNPLFHQQSVAENTANLCPNAIGQYIFAALLHETKEDLQLWFQKQRVYYKHMAQRLTHSLQTLLPDLIISKPDAAMYTVLDFRKICGETFDSAKFAMYCAKEGKVWIQGQAKTLLTAPMEGFYSSQENSGKTQLRIAYVEPPEIMEEVPFLCSELLKSYLQCREDA